MRFIENGPSIPDALLNARDEGRVVFFCGAGVSHARAGLPDFFGLAEAVIRELGVPKDSDARKVLEKAREIGDEVSVTGLISADRVFGLLEREFMVADIQAAVAKSLAPKVVPDLSAHRLLLRLATTSERKTQLVTTNFDRLFEKCGSNVAVYHPPVCRTRRVIMTWMASSISTAARTMTTPRLTDTVSSCPARISDTPISPKAGQQNSSEKLCVGMSWCS